jgi:SAM-dependent methyltransferase
MLREWWFSWLMRAAAKHHEPLVAAQKQRLLGDLTGDVLEIGPGSGVNLPYLRGVRSWTGYEPNRFLARRIAVPPGGRLLVAPFAPDGRTYDAVVSTLVLCSVAEPLRVLRQLRSCLRPGGKLVFLEHVAAAEGSNLRRQQERWLPVWRMCAGGCCPNRPTREWIERAGFRVVWIEEFCLPLGLASPHIAGVAEPWDELVV